MKSFILHIILIAFSFFSLAYIGNLQKSSKILTREKSLAENIRLRVFGKGGEEWKIEGKELVSFGADIILLKVEMKSAGGYTVKADSIIFNKHRNKGLLKENVEIRGTGFFVKTKSAEIDFSRNTLRGKERVYIWKGTNYIEGKSFLAYLKPLRVIIEEVRTKHEP